MCVDREESMRGEGRARGDSGQRGNVPHSACACVIDVRVLSMCVRARVPFTFNFRKGCLCPALLNRNKG